MSYSSKLTESLGELPIKKKCCRESYGYGVSFSDNLKSGVPVPSMKCDNCRAHLLRGMFSEYGSVTDPEKQYHLEFSFAERESADEAYRIVSEIGENFSMYTRKGRFIVYIKSSDSISEFLAYIGANVAAFEIMNTKIMNGMRSDVTRAVNFDTANIKRSTVAFERDLQAIKALSELGEIEKLPPHLRETAELRAKYDHATLGELGVKHSAPISKSGVKHRLDAIYAVYQRLVCGEGPDTV